MIYLTYSAIFLFVAAALFEVTNLDENIHAGLKRREKSERMRQKKKTPLTKLIRLERRRRQLIFQAKVPKSVYWLLTALGAGGGAMVGKLFFQEMLFSAAVGTLGALSPLFYFNYKVIHTRGQQVEKLRSSMMILSNSYIVTEDLLKTVQDNIDLLEYPAPFRDFLTYVTLIDGNIKTGLRRMEQQVGNIYFSQWIDVLVLAQDDRSLKYVTMSVVDAMHDVHQAQREADTAMYAIWREYFTVLIMIFSVPMIFRVLMPPAYVTLVTTLPGQALLVLLLAAVVYSLIRATQLNRPLFT